MISHQQSTGTNNLCLGTILSLWPPHRPSQGLRYNSNMLNKAYHIFDDYTISFWHILTLHSTICPCSSPSTGGSTRATPIYSSFSCSISSIITTAPLISFSSPPSPPAAAAAPHATPPAPSTFQARWPPLLLTPSLCLIMALDQNMRIFLFLCQWQILIQTMNPLWIYDLPHLNHLLMADHLGGDQRDKLPRGKVKAIHWHNCTCILHLNVPVFHTIMYGYPIGCQYSGILFAPSTMLNTG